MPSDRTHQQTFDQGLRVRTEVLGAEHVARAMHNSSDFVQPLQELVTEYCWGTVWSRPGLDRRTRSMINVATLTALNRDRELAANVRGALNNGVTREELQEILLQTAVYVGIPGALWACRIIEEVLAEHES